LAVENPNCPGRIRARQGLFKKFEFFGKNRDATSTNSLLCSSTAQTPGFCEGAKQMEIMTVRDLSDYLHCHPSTIYRMLAKGELPGFKVGGDWRFRIDDIDRWCKKMSFWPKSEWLDR
jgi:excisionase family DNA binding protein